MKKSDRGADSDHVTLTLGERQSMANALVGREFPCQLCGAGLEICISKRLKPYTTCLKCGVQNFYRGKEGIRRLSEILDSHLLITANESSVDAVVILYNRIQLLRAQRKGLAAKKLFYLADPDLENAILAVDKEIERMQGDLKKIAKKSRQEQNK
jgi:hypothetical protein